MVAQVMAENSRVLSKAMAPMSALIERLDSYEINQQQMRTALVIIGENNIPPERMGSKFVEIVQQYKVLETSTGSTRQGDPTNVAALRADVQRAIETGNLAKADLLLEEIGGRVGVKKPHCGRYGGCERGGDFRATRRTRPHSIALHRGRSIFRQRRRTSFRQVQSLEDKRIEYLRKEAGAFSNKGWNLATTMRFLRRSNAIRSGDVYPARSRAAAMGDDSE